MTIADRLSELRHRIARQERACGHPPGSVTLVAVSKTFGAEAAAEALAAGQRVFGENRVQEALGKWPALKAAQPDITLHLIGPLQSNKARDAVALFDVIETVDREKIAAALAVEIARTERRPKLYVQVNTGLEPQKAGIDPREAVDFVGRCRAEHGLRIDGLMCIPPEGEAPAPHFALLFKLARDCAVTDLSMGMSGDFEAAIEQGATHIRIGSAIFGQR